MPKEKKKVVIRPVRGDSYELRAISGFALHAGADEGVILDCFIDLPPLGSAIVNPETKEEALVVERKYLAGFVMGKNEVRKLGEQLLQAAERMES